MTKKYYAEFLTEVETFTSKKIVQKDDIQIIINEAELNDLIDDFEDLCFTAKYVNGLFRAVKLADGNPEIKNIDNVKTDIAENLDKVVKMLEGILKSASSDSSSKIRNKYLTAEQKSLQNLLILINDLDQVKKYLNLLKRK